MKLTLKPRIHTALAEMAHSEGHSCAKFINDILEAVAKGELIYPQKEGNNENKEITGKASTLR